jgi:Fur family ferric uptake transcriptional regulator
MQTNDNNADLLKHEGLKNTKHRTAIIKMLEQSEQPLTAEQIYLELKEKNSSINLSTVYRILNVLTTKSILNKSDFEEKTLFEINANEHTHRFICSECKKMFKIIGCPLEGYEKNLHDKLGIEITGHKLELYGLCKGCKLNKIK